MVCLTGVGFKKLLGGMILLVHLEVHVGMNLVPVEVTGPVKAIVYTVTSLKSIAL